MEKFMEEWFIENEREYNGIPIIKDNFEGLFQAWTEQLGVDDWFRFADLYGQKTVIDYIKERLEKLNK